MSVGRELCLFIELPPSETGHAILPPKFYRHRLILQVAMAGRSGRHVVNLRSSHARQEHAERR